MKFSAPKKHVLLDISTISLFTHLCVTVVEEHVESREWFW